jgi:hypothetical protein
MRVYRVADWADMANRCKTHIKNSAQDQSLIDDGERLAF